MRSELVVVGAGPAGLAAAISARNAGIKDVVIIERDIEAGGILNQCIHSGFGLRYFKEELTGPEYAEKFVELAKELGISFMFDTMVLSVSSKKVTTLSKNYGLLDIDCEAVVLAMGCRERTRFAIATPGSRPSGVLTAGLAQRYINIEGRNIGKRAIILGSGDIGLIMARRLTLEGAKVLACIEIMPYSGGLTRNIAQCLDDYNIPLLLSHTVTEIHGKDRLMGVTIAKVDDRFMPIEETEEFIECDTLLLSVGLIPENELSTEAGIEIDSSTKGPVVFDNNETSIEGIFACGNVLQVHDLVDYVSEEAERAGKAAARYILNGAIKSNLVISTFAGENVSYVLPQKIRPEGKSMIDFYLRVKNPILQGDIVIKTKKREIKRIKRSHLSPGEMEIFHLNADTIPSDILVSVEVRE